MGKCLLAIILVQLLIAPGVLSMQESELRPSVSHISPTSGPEGTRVVINGNNLKTVSRVEFGDATAQFRALSPQQLVAIVPHRSKTSIITLTSSAGSAASSFTFTVLNDPRVPDEVSYKAGYVNSAPKPENFTSVRLWGIAIADARVADYQSAQVEVAWTQLSCRVNGMDVILNDDTGRVSGGLYLRNPWFGGHDFHEMMPVMFDASNRAVILRMGQHPDRVWHFWSPSPRASLPRGILGGCTAKARVRISQGGLLQLGFDYWRSPSVPYGPGGNNQEAGASDWYLPSGQWQEAVFTDIGGPQF